LVLRHTATDEQPDCSEHKDLVKPCSELATNASAQNVCTPSVLSTFINRVTINFPFFGVVLFWAQFAFLGVYLIVFLTTLFKVPQIDQEQVDRDLEEEEEEGLLGRTSPAAPSRPRMVPLRRETARGVNKQCLLDRLDSPFLGID
jgi:LMBR1 domain-containing protein 1